MSSSRGQIIFPLALLRPSFKPQDFPGVGPKIVIYRFSAFASADILAVFCGSPLFTTKISNEAAILLSERWRLANNRLMLGSRLRVGIIIVSSVIFVPIPRDGTTPRWPLGFPPLHPLDDSQAF